MSWKLLIALSTLTVWSAGVTEAAPADYRYDLLTQQVFSGVGRHLQVSLWNLRRNAAVPGATITAPRLDRSPDNVAGIVFPAFFEPTSEYGVYGFRGDLPTAGNWALTFQAQIPGEPAPVQGSVVVRVVDPAKPVMTGSPQEASSFRAAPSSAGGQSVGPVPSPF